MTHPVARQRRHVYHLGIGEGGSSNILKGFRRVGHPTTPEGFGSIRQTGFAGHSIRQLTCTSSTLQVQLGDDGAVQVPQIYILMRFPQIDPEAFSILTWSPGNQRFETSPHPAFYPWLVANLGGITKVEMRAFPI